eukprot:TRINITY_DN38681_c0_g1_i1.p1 TRINITY_DN38681_c0_g1~~TRINITY_DN38681_c0_g1_i1.p1  ORF type:complete len:110 (-),score=0.93 TRINITY_DN38681_c0_g1_i1:25-354(-)
MRGYWAEIASIFSKLIHGSASWNLVALCASLTLTTPVRPRGGTPGCPSAAEVKLSLIHISEPTRLLSISYAVFCLKKKKNISYLNLVCLSIYNILSENIRLDDDIICMR